MFSELNVNTETQDEFVWEDYLEHHSALAAPAPAFLHVEKSQESGILADQLVEVVNQLIDGKDGGQFQGYWPARVVTSCGPLLRLLYITDDTLPTSKFWHDINDGRLHPIGWAEGHEIPLKLPTDLLLFNTVVEETKHFARLIINEGISVPAEAFEGNGFIIADRIKKGMKLEILCEQNPRSGWPATVLHNCGGRLLVSPDSPDNSLSGIWIFYQHPRLKPADWIHEQGLPWRYSNPKSQSCYEEDDTLLKMYRKDAQRNPVPKYLFNILPSCLHCGISVGMLLEAVNPIAPYNIHVAKVHSVVDNQYFQVIIENKGEPIIWTTDITNPLLLPVGFCKEAGIPIVPPKDWQGGETFHWDTYISTNVQDILPINYFKHTKIACEMGFEINQKLEAVNPEADQDICAASIVKVFKHLLWITLDSTHKSLPFIRPTSSLKIFPIGWCQSNHYPLQCPIDFHSNVKEIQILSRTPCNNIDDGAPSRWCPLLFINHCCFSGPYLSKTKVAKQSQSVGPGSIDLVLRKVISMTINAAYIPTRALREIERTASSSYKIPASWQPITLKAKFKRYTYAATIPVATQAGDLSYFLRFMCETLQCCPNLWSLVQVGDKCSLRCTAVSQSSGNHLLSRGRGRGPAKLLYLQPSGHRGGKGLLVAGGRGSNRNQRRRKGGRKRLFVPLRTPRPLFQNNSEEVCEQMEELYEDDVEGEEDEDGGEEYYISCSDDGDVSSHGCSRPSSPSMEPTCGVAVASSRGRGSRGKRKCRIFPRMEMTTRGVKLPDYRVRRGGTRVGGSKQDDVFCIGERGGERSSSASSNRDDLYRSDTKKMRTIENDEGVSSLHPADVCSDPFEWNVKDVEQYVASQPAISHHAVKLREQEIDGRAFLLLNLPTLEQHLNLPHSSAVALAQHVCRVKLAHIVYYRAEG